MKRFFVLSVAMAIASSSFAYYGDYAYSSPGMPGWFTFMGIVMIVWGILEIILFFKIWGMTDNVKALKKDYFNETVFESKEDLAGFLRKNLVLGNMENVKKALLKNFKDNVESGYADIRNATYVTSNPTIDGWINYRDKNLKTSIRPYVENLQKQYDKIGEQIPVYILRMETFEDYYKLFVKEELEVKIENKTEEKND